MARTNIDIDDELLRHAMQRFHLHTKREAVNYALRKLLGDPMTRDEALAMEGYGWDGDLDQIRASDTIVEYDIHPDTLKELEQLSESRGRRR
ncbi:MAG TPA: type II toxin-antitoxin system VapB family antitoxin [Chloroflexota bacterium]|jgi:Arc/MetJ family transcription regulator